MASAMRYAALGGMLYCGVVNGTGSTGLVSIDSPVSTSRHAEFCIPIRRSASSRHDLRQEPYAVALHVRICAGGGQQWPSLPRPVNHSAPSGPPAIRYGQLLPVGKGYSPMAICCVAAIAGKLNSIAAIQ